MGIKMRDKANGVFHACHCRLGKYFFLKLLANSSAAGCSNV